MNAANIEGLACIGIGVIAVIVYAVVTAMSLVFCHDDDDMLPIAYIIGGVLFVTVVLLWATTECPFFVGVE